MTNEHLRDHVQRIGFNLSLGRTHIAALVYLEELRKVKFRGDLVRIPNSKMSAPPMMRAFANIVTGFHGLESRGLLIHTYVPDRDKPKFAKQDDGTWQIQHSSRVWKITPAGRLVIKLLQEAGIYADYSALLERPEVEEKIA